MQEFINLIKSIIEEFAPVLAVALWNFEESKVAAAKQDQKTAELKLKEAQNEKDVKDSVSGLSDTDVIDKLTGNGSKPKDS